MKYCYKALPHYETLVTKRGAIFNQTLIQRTAAAKAEKEAKNRKDREEQIRQKQIREKIDRNLKINRLEKETDVSKSFARIFNSFIFNSNKTCRNRNILFKTNVMNT